MGIGPGMDARLNEALDEAEKTLKDVIYKAERELRDTRDEARERLDVIEQRITRRFTIIGTVLGAVVIGGLVAAASLSIEESRSKVADKVMDLQKDIIQAQGIVTASAKEIREADQKVIELETRMTSDGAKLDKAETALRDADARLTAASANYEGEKVKLDSLTQKAAELINRAASSAH